MIITEPYFCQDATNVYRTKDFIVKQRVFFRENDPQENHLASFDTYYARTCERDAIYEAWFADRFNIDGKRIKTAMYTRTYID